MGPAGGSSLRDQSPDLRDRDTQSPSNGARTGIRPYSTLIPLQSAGEEDIFLAELSAGRGDNDDDCDGSGCGEQDDHWTAINQDCSECRPVSVNPSGTRMSHAF